MMDAAALRGSLGLGLELNAVLPCRGIAFDQPIEMRTSDFAKAEQLSTTS